MLTFIELLIGVVVIVGVARYIIKGYSATGVLFVGGLALLIVSALMGHQVLPSGAESTGYTATDIVEYIKILLMSRGGDLGMMIMMLCGFAAYMTHIGANDMVVKLATGVPVVLSTALHHNHHFHKRSALYSSVLLLFLG
jgi:DcuC family C4-dicarboxylate transporter